MAAPTPPSFVQLGNTGYVDGRALFEIVDGDLVDEDTQELIALSLFTWRRALDSDPIPDGASRQGWFGDPEMGSRLYLLQQDVTTIESLAAAKQYAEEALKWLVDDAIFATVSATATAVMHDATRQPVLSLSIEITRPLQPERRERYAYLWSA